MDHYLNESELNSAMRTLADAYPDDCTLFDLPHKTHENRAVGALRIGRKTATDVLGRPKVGILFTGSAHAREWGGADILIYLASDLLKAYAAGKGLKYSVLGKGPGITFTAQQLQKLRDRVDLLLVPCVNPDGRAYSMSVSPLWRKNRNPASSGGQANRVGVDINRNFDFLWDFRKAFAASVQSISSMASDDPASDNFRGTAPNSEPETKNVVGLFDDNPHVAYFVDVHSYTGDVLYSWGDAPNQNVRQIQHFLNPAFDGRRGIDDLSIYGEYIREERETTAATLAKTITSAIKDVTGEDYATTQGYYLAPGIAGGGQGQIYPTGGAADDYASSRSGAVPGARPVLGFTLEFHRYGGPNFQLAYHPPFPKMAEIITEVDAGLIALCVSAERLHDVPPKIPELFGEVLFGVTVDGGGLVIINGKPHPVPPWDPLIPALTKALQVYMNAAALPLERSNEAQVVALNAMSDAIKTAIKLKSPN